MAAEKVHILHPASGAESAVTRAAFERRSSKLGWILADSHLGEIRQHGNPSDPADTPPVETGSTNDRDVLVAVAESMGLKVHHRAKPETIRRQIEKAKAGL